MTLRRSPNRPSPAPAMFPAASSSNKIFRTIPTAANELKTSVLVFAVVVGWGAQKNGP